MGKELLACPGCGKMVEAGTPACPHCGMNIQTGETFEAKVQRAKERTIRPERLGTRLAVATLFVLALVFLGGFLYQRRAERVFRDKPEVFAGYLMRLEQMDSLAAAGKTADALALGEALVKELNARESSIVIEDAPTTQQARDTKRVPKAVRRAEKGLLHNLARKVEYKLNMLSAKPPQS